MAGACGACTLCCTVMKVAMEPPKPERTRCPHECKSGCGIYADRPEPCRVFQCAWLVSQEWEADERLPASMRPDKTGVVIEVNSAGYLVAHSKQPAAWKREPMRQWLMLMAARTRVLIEPGEGVMLLEPSGKTLALNFVGIDPITNEKLYRRDLGGEL